MKRMCTLVGLVVLAAACNGAAAGDEFVGQWVNVKRAKDTVIVDREGSAFLFKESSPSIFDGKMHTDSFPAALKDGQLTVVVGGFNVKFSIEKATGNLATADGRKYARLR